MNLSSTKSGVTNTKVSTEQKIPAMVQRLAQQVIAVGLGILGGASGVAMALTLAIVVQLSLPPASSYLPGVTSTAVSASVLGVGISWLISRLAHLVIPNPSLLLTKQGLQIILVFSVLTSLLQSFLFVHGL